MDTIGMRRVNRRRLAAGVAWAVPAITVATALPAYAASCDESCTSLNSKLSFGTALNQNGWSGSQAGTYKGDTAAVFLSSWSPAADTTNCSGSSRSCGSGGGSKTNIILFGGDPSTLNNTTSPPSHYIDYKSANFCLHTGVS